MKTLKFISMVFCLLSLPGLFSSCEKKTKSDYDSFLIYVDSIQLSDNISANIPFDIYFYGLVGTSGCYEFSHFKTGKSNNEISVESWGKKEMNSGICPAIMVFLNGEKLNYIIEKAGDYLIKIKQPDNSYLEKQITIE